MGKRLTGTRVIWLGLLILLGSVLGLFVGAIVGLFFGRGITVLLYLASILAFFGGLFVIAVGLFLKVAGR